MAFRSSRRAFITASNQLFVDPVSNFSSTSRHGILGTTSRYTASTPVPSQYTDVPSPRLRQHRPLSLVDPVVSQNHHSNGSQSLYSLVANRCFGTVANTSTTSSPSTCTTATVTSDPTSTTPSSVSSSPPSPTPAPRRSAFSPEHSPLWPRQTPRNYAAPSYVGQRNVFASQVREYAARDTTPIDLSRMLRDGINATPHQLVKSARFLCRELPVRLAKRIVELESLPYGLSHTEPVMQVRSWYEDSFSEVISTTPPSTPEEDDVFTDMLENILQRHADVVPMLARGVLMIKDNLVLHNNSENGAFSCPFLTSFLDRFYMSRLGIRMLISQHCALHHPRPGFCGIIALNMDPVEVAEVAISDASRLAEKNLGACPEVNIIVDNVRQSTIPYVPSHLHHMLFELLKNSMRATVEFHGNDKPYDLPPIDLVFVSGEHDFSIKVSDQGGGIRRKDLNMLFTYLHTTAPKTVQEALLSNEKLSGSGLTEAPLAGFGYGLPVSRIFAKYFGGDLQIVTMPGYGTDAFLWLPKLSNQRL